MFLSGKVLTINLFHLVCQFVWHDPCDFLSFYVRLKVIAFDRDETFAQRLGRDHVMHKFNFEFKRIILKESFAFTNSKCVYLRDKRLHK